MSERKRVVLLVGSPKGLGRSASAKLGRAVTNILEASGWQFNAFHLHAAVSAEDELSKLLAAIDASDLVVLSMPLYVDSLPAPVIHVLHDIAAHRSQSTSNRAPHFFSILNCGFVDPWQNSGAQNMLRLFCKQARLEHVGEISLGSGGAPTGRVVKALKLAAAALNEGKRIPERVADLTKRRPIPAFMYIVGGNFMWKKQSKRNGVRDQLKAQPYKRA
ncbi:hypothetical protein ACFLSG_04660 [Candidatus Bipolaricaulota bacterium]